MTKNILVITENLKKVARDCLNFLENNQNLTKCKYSFSKENNREMKAQIDLLIESYLIESLKKFGFPIISEEKGSISSRKDSDFRFIIDPIDGTVNLIRGIGESSISIALYDKNDPIFGVLACYPSGRIVWGGPKFKAYEDSKLISVSDISDPIRGVLCTGFPSNFSHNKKSYSDFINKILPFGKIRMIGSASQSILAVARGSAELYYEEKIQLWDVAAAIAIAQGAGARISIKFLDDILLNLRVDNGLISL